MTREEEIMLEAIMFAQVPELPLEANDETPIWIYAIAKAIKYNTAPTYVIVKNSYGETPSVIKSFDSGGIAKITNIYPYKFLDKKFIPSFEKESSAKNFVAKVYGVDKTEVGSLKKETVLRLMYNYCIKRQLEAEREEMRANQAKAEQEAGFNNRKKLREQE